MNCYCFGECCCKVDKWPVEFTVVPDPLLTAPRTPVVLSVDVNGFAAAMDRISRAAKAILVRLGEPT